jgi:hypothetical protein
MNGSWRNQKTEDPTATHEFKSNIDEITGNSTLKYSGFEYLTKAFFIIYRAVMLLF